jgi:hypothetical protein
MSSVFEDACAAASAAVDTVYAKPWKYLPMAAADPNARKSPDPDRAVIDIQLVGRITIRRYASPEMAGYAGACHRAALCADRWAPTRPTNCPSEM